jgi:uncharacterized Zn-binding protein involved in type VI secretion
MAQPAAKQNDRITAMDTHIVMVPSASGQVPTTIPGHPFDAALAENLSTDVKIDGQAAAVVGSVARTNLLQHPPLPPGVAYQVPPTFEGRITMGSTSVFINGKAAARAGDPAMTCNDIPIPPPGAGTVVVATSTVFIGG